MKLLNLLAAVFLGMFLLGCEQKSDEEKVMQELGDDMKQKASQMKEDMDDAYEDWRN